MSPYLNKEYVNLDLHDPDHFLVGKFNMNKGLAYVVLPRWAKLSILGMQSQSFVITACDVVRCGGVPINLTIGMSVIRVK